MRPCVRNLDFGSTYFQAFYVVFGQFERLNSNDVEVHRTLFKNDFMWKQNDLHSGLICEVGKKSETESD